MNFIDRVKLRRLIPAGVVALVIAFAYMAPLPAEASKTNNCGVKGGYAYGGYAFAFHNPGKPCPNRPFPGQGKGILKLLSGGIASAEDTKPSKSTEPAAAKSHKTSASRAIRTQAADAGITPSVITKDTPAAAKSHGQGKGHANGEKDLDV